MFLDFASLKKGQTRSYGETRTVLKGTEESCPSRAYKDIMPQDHQIQKGRSSEGDLKAQLEHIQNRINAETEDVLSKRNNKKSTPFSNILTKRDKRTSVPLFAGSDVHKGVLNSGSSKDVNFVVGLSENLLQECRRLQAENEKKSAKLKTLHEEYISIQENLQQLTTKYQHACKEEDSLKDANWELEAKLQNVMKEFKDLSGSYNKTQAELQKQRNVCEEFKAELEEVVLERRGLREELESKQQQYAIEIKDLKAHIQELNEENDQLHSKMSQLKIQVDELASKVGNTKSVSDKPPDAEKDNFKKDKDHFDNLSSSAKLATEELRFSEPNDLESQTMQVNLEQANQTIGKLRQQILRLKAERKGSPRTIRSSRTNTPVPVRRTNGVQEFKDFSTPSKVKATEHDSTNVTQQSGSPSGDTRASVHGLLSDVTADSFGLSEDSRAVDLDSEGESDISETMDVIRNPLYDELVDSDNEDEQESSITYAEVKKYTDAHDLVVLPNREYENIKHLHSERLKSEEEIMRSGRELNIFAFPNDISTEKKPHILSQQEKIHSLEENGYHVISEDDFEEIKKKMTLLDLPTEAFLSSKANLIDQRLISNEKYQELVEPSVQKIIEKLEHLGFEAVAKEKYAEMLRELDNPSMEYLRSKLSASGNKVIPISEYETLISPPLDELKKMATKSGYTLIKEDALSALNSKVDNPSVEFLSQKARSANYHLISENDHSELINPSLGKLSELASHAEKVVISKKEYEDFMHPSLENLQREASEIGYFLLSPENYEELFNPSIEKMKQMASSLDYIMISTDEYKTIRNPPISVLEKQANEINFTLVQAEEHQKTLDRLDSLERPDIAHLTSRADELDHVVVERALYEKLEAQIQNPPYEIAKLYADTAGKVLIDTSYSQQLISNFEHPPLTFLKEKASDLGYRVIQGDEYTALLKSVETPTSQYLEEKAAAQGGVLLAKLEHENLKMQLENPAEEYLKKKASTQGLELITIAELTQLRNQIAEPSREYLSKKAENSGHILITSTIHDELLEIKETPSLEFLKNKARNYQHTIIANDELNELMDRYDNPSLDYLKSKAVGSQIIPLELYNRFLELENSPSLDFLIKKSEMRGYDLLSKHEHEAIIRRVLNPTIQELAENAKKIGHIVIPEEEYSQLRKSFENPSKAFIQKMAACHDLVAIDQTEHEKLQNATQKQSIFNAITSYGYVALPLGEISALESSRIENASLSALKRRLEDFGYYAITFQKFRELNRPFLETVDQLTTISLCQKYGLKAVPVEEYNDLKTNTDAILSKEELIEQAESHGYVVVLRSAFEEMKEYLANPSLEYLEKHSVKKRKLLVDEEVYEKNMKIIREPSLDMITHSASLLGYTIVACNEYEVLQNNLAAPSQDFIEEKAGKLGLAVIFKSELDDLQAKLEHPPLSYLTTKSLEMGQTIIRQAEYDTLIRKDSFPTREELQEKASALNMKTIPLDEHEKVVKILKEPLDFARSTAAANNIIMLDKARYEEIMEFFTNPSFEELSERASNISAVLMSELSYRNMKDENENPSMDRLQSLASHRNLTLMDRESYETAKQQLELLKNPNPEILQELAEQLNYTALPNTEFENVKSLANVPSESHLVKNAERFDKVLVDSKEYQSLKDVVSAPGIEFLKEKCSLVDMKILKSVEYQELLDRADNPSLRCLEENIAKYNRIMLPAEKFEQLDKAIKQPTLEYLKDNAMKYHKILIDEDELRGLKDLAENPDLNTMKRCASLHNLVLLPSEELEKMQSTIKCPTKEYLYAQLENQGLVALSKDEFVLLTEKDKDLSLPDIKNAAKEHDYVLLSSSEYKSLEQPSLSKLEEGLKSHNQVVMDAETYSILLNSTKDKISKEEVIDLCNRFSLKTVSIDQYNDFITMPSVEKLQKFAGDIGYVALPRKEYDTLKVQAEHPDRKTIEKAADSLDLILVKSKEYETLSKKLENPTKAQVERGAQKLGLTVVPLEEYNDLSREASARTTSGGNIGKPSKVLASKEYFEKVIREESSPQKKERILESAKSLGLVTLSSDEYKKLVENQKDSTLSKTDLYNGAKEFDLTIIPTEEYMALLKKKNSRQVTYKELESYATRLNLRLIPIEPKLKTAKPIDNSEESEQSDRESFISSSASSIDEEEFYDAFQSTNSVSTNYSLSTSETNYSQYTDAFDDNLEEIEDNVSQVSTVRDEPVSHGPTVEDLSIMAKGLGYKLVSLTADSRSSVNPPESSHQTNNKENVTPDLAASDDDSVNELFTDAWDEEELKLRAAKISMVLITQGQYKEYESLKGKEKNQTQTHLEDRSCELEFIAPPASLTDVQDKALGTEQLREESLNFFSGNGKYTRDSIISAAPQFGLHVLSQDEFVEMKQIVNSMSSIPDDFNKPKGIHEGVMKQEAYGTPKEVMQENSCTVEEGHINATEGIRTVPKSEGEESLRAKASKLGMVLLKKEQFDNMNEKLQGYDSEKIRYANLPASSQRPETLSCSEDQLKGDTVPCNQVMISKESYDRLYEMANESKEQTYSKEVIIEKAHQLGLVPLESDQFEQIKEELARSSQNLTVEDIMLKAAEFGLVPIKKDQFDQIKKELANPSLTKEQIVEHANSFGLAAVDLHDYELLKRQSIVNATSLIIDDDEAHSGEADFDFDENRSDRKKLNSLAKKLGILCVPESSFVPTSTCSVPDSDNVVVLPITYYHNLLAKEQETFDRLTNDELQAEAKKRGFLVGHTKKEVGAPASAHAAFFGSRISRQNSNKSLASNESNTRKSLAEAAASAAYNEFEQQHHLAKSRCHSRSSSINRTIAYSMESESPQVRRTSFDAGISLATMASLSEPSIIPALTQTVIGEYLYKYYRRLGPISNLSSRHERYFWIHPYTMTLYWSSSNPVLESPAHNKTRAAAILGVESVSDSNPYPTGLYHKSIVVKTEARSVKFTCSTRQRHNIWFNSLRYLIQRNMDGINLDEDGASDPPEANKIYQLPGESVRHANQRLSSTRRLASSSKVNRSTSMKSVRK